MRASMHTHTNTQTHTWTTAIQISSVMLNNDPIDSSSYQCGYVAPSNQYY